MTPDARDPLESRLRADAATWDAAPSSDVTRRVAAALEASALDAGPRRRQRWIKAAAAVVIVGLGCWWAAARSGTRTPTADGSTRRAPLLSVSLEDASIGGVSVRRPLAPLEHELVAVADDANALAAAIWRRMPAALATLVPR